MDISAQVIKNNCPLCGREKIYKTLKSFKANSHKNCRSCINSIIAGGIGGKINKFGELRCSSCLIFKSPDDFHKYKKTNKPYSRCIECHRNISKTYFKEVYRYTQYGLSKDEYEKLLLKQQNNCAGCKMFMEDPHVDHCHATGKVRGLLCHGCNAAIGFIKDSVSTLTNLIKYLENQ